MAKAKAAAAEQEVPTVAMSKADAVRAALKEGIDKPAEGVEYIKSNFGVDITNQVFSSYKSNELKRDGGQSGAVKVPNGKKAANGAGADLFKAAETVKALVQAHGAANVRKLVDLFE